MNFNSILNFVIEKLSMLPMMLPGFLLAITLHELAHGYTAYVLGDPTAKNQGRLTINPIAHVDVMGFLLLITVGFGWAKPVPINPTYFKRRKLGTILVSIAGPLTNFIIAVILSLLLVFMPIDKTVIINIIKIAIFYNIVLGFFNLLPFPPLDGSKIIASVLPNKYEFLFYKYERYLYMILILLILTDTIPSLLNPLIHSAQQLLNWMIFNIYQIIY